MAFWLPLLICLVLLLAPVGGPAFAKRISAPFYAEHGAWLLACDNTRRCTARGLDTTNNAAIQISRDAGDAPIIITLAVPTPEKFPVPPLVRLAGRVLILGSPDWKTHAAEWITTITTAAPRAVRALLAADRNARTLALSGGYVIPLDDLAGVLREMGAIQDRAGSLNPPIRPRWRRPAGLSRSEAAVLIASVHRWAAGLLLGTGCAERPTLEHDAAYALDARRAVVLLACPYNSYQGETFAFIVPRAGGVPAPFTPHVPVLGTLREPLGDETFDPATGVLTSRQRGAGLANCGTRAAWVWSAGAFRLVSLTHQAACSGPFADDWPVLFRTAPYGH
ncbi:MAG: DUF1176 domain-containing protein [Stellaceae bacterium]